MDIKVTVSKNELNEMEFDRYELVEHIIDTLDGDTKELEPYNVEIVVY